MPVPDSPDHLSSIHNSQFAIRNWQSAIFLLICILGLWLRVWQLDLRPMHHDEANQAVRTGILLETGVYRYDPADHHGPSLYYLSLPFVWASGGRSFASTTEVTLRLVPALFGVALIPMLLALRRGLSGVALAVAAVLTAISPAMVFFSRFYIQEMLLVFFTFGALACGWLYFLRRSASRAAACGLFLGLMFATKETSVLAYTAMGAGLLALLLSDRRQAMNWLSTLRCQHVGWLVFSALAVPVVLFSSFFTHPAGLVDMFRSFAIYFFRGLGDSLHLHPWYFYLKPLLYQYEGRGPHWSEAVILALALIAIVVAWLRPNPAAGNTRLVRFLAVYAVVLTVLYSVISHKTPWCLTSFHHGLIILAGFGAVAAVDLARRGWIRALIGILLAAGFSHLAWLSAQANFRYFADPVNPYVYAHTNLDFLNLVKRVEQVARVAPEGRGLLIEVVADPYSMWPLPWYLRRFPKVGYWEDPAQVPKGHVPGIVITTPELQPQLSAGLDTDFQGEFYGLRPSVLMLIYIRRDLWERVLESQSGKR
ncbi:MAG: TIGR03663 family protein [Acidobacteria bacterium]|nr:MAG: TIGR03663 family protein [Acidobacteriota bacterium]